MRITKQTKDRAITVGLPSQIHERLRKVADRDGLKLKALTAKAITKGLDDIEREQQTAANVAAGQST